MNRKEINLPLFPEPDLPPGHDPLFYELSARRDGYTVITGVDEAGRGTLAGPVVAAAIILPEEITLSGVKDSKTMTEKARNRAFSRILENAVAVSIGVVSHRSIDEINILNASLEAMKRAVSGMMRELEADDRKEDIP